MVVKQVSDLCLREAGRGFIISLKASSRYSLSYLDSLGRAVALVALYSEEQHWPPVPDITASHIEEYLTYLQSRPRWFGAREAYDSRPVSQSYIEAQYRRLNRFFNWLIERGRIEDNPLRLIEHPHVDDRTIPTVSEHEMLGLLKLLDQSHARGPAHRFRLIRNRAALYLLWDTPGRRNEIAMADVEGVDLESGAILVVGKGRRERWMPIGNTAVAILWEYLQARTALNPPTRALWVSEQGQAMQPGWLYLMLKRLGNRAGIPSLHTHRFRHSYAVNALRNGMPERVLQIVGGWRKIPDTYFRTLGAEDAQQFHRQVSPGDRLGKELATPKKSRQRSQSKPLGKL